MVVAGVASVGLAKGLGEEVQQMEEVVVELQEPEQKKLAAVVVAAPVRRERTREVEEVPIRLGQMPSKTASGMSAREVASSQWAEEALCLSALSFLDLLLLREVVAEAVREPVALPPWVV